jgi:hypothetical protein
VSKFDVSDKTYATPPYCLDVARMLRIVTQSGTKVEDVLTHQIRRNAYAAPNFFE